MTYFWKLHLGEECNFKKHIENICHVAKITYHVTYEFQRESTLYSLPECQGNALLEAGAMSETSFRLRTKWLWVQILLLSLQNINYMFFNG